MQHPFKDLSLLRGSILPMVTACLAVAACQDASEPVAPKGSIIAASQDEGRAFAHRLYAVGTSISAGTCSDGNTASCQQNSWVAQIIRAMGHEPVLPLIQAPGCKSPFAAPLISFVRQSGESAGTPEDALSCAPNEDGVTLPTQVLAVPGALTHEALLVTPESKPEGTYGRRLYSRLLPPSRSQVTALEDTNPKFVTVELGANDIMGIHGGRVQAGYSYVPFSTWAYFYNLVVDRVAAVADEVLLVGLGNDISRLNSLRTGSELWADRDDFRDVFNVKVSGDCNGSANLIVVPRLVVPAVANGLQRLAAGLSAYTLSCTEGAPDVEDRILTPAEVAEANAQFARMTQFIQQQATQRGYAYMNLEVLFSIPKGPFSVVSLMTSSTPYGPNISLDGLHPTAAGQTLIAQAALQAIDDRYHFGLGDVVLSLSRNRGIRQP